MTGVFLDTTQLPGDQKPETISFVAALREAHREALAADDRVFVMGEDVADYGSTYGVTRDLHIEFGADRVRNTPLSESGFVGCGIGAALGGMRPIVEIMTVNFSLLALDQIVNTAATFLHMSGGQCNVPLVVRMATGAGHQLGAQHSHSLEGWYAHVPGLRVIAPATVTDARRMLAAALADPDPVIMFEHSGLYSTKGTVDADVVDLGSAAVRRPGTDLTMVTWGGCLSKVLAAAELLSEQGIEVEVIDLRSLRPIDTPAILESVTRTKRAMVIDEGWRSVGLSAEISARIHEGCFEVLQAPVGRVCTAEMPIPYARHLEQAALPQIEDIVVGAQEVLARGN
jgi:pyruvate dehydrogenase E1 component beta subunit